MVARNSVGFLVEGRLKLTSAQVDVVVAEAIGIREVLSWLKDRQWPQVFIETDSLCVVQALHSSIHMISLFGSVIQDCKNLLASFHNVVVSFVKRSANVVAHTFAKAARLYCTFSLESIPTELLPCLVADVRV
uniref:RNase H type-1 domain-containing protein n=1 Tax=Cannabis sativa TaxID=3483 RepID=A0A803QKM0_CANSA